MSRRCPSCGTEYPDAIAFCGHDGSVNIEVIPAGGTPDPRLGEKLGDYIVVAHVADGAMGAVYEARNAETRARVAVKVLHADVEEDEIAVERFKREYETAQLLDHPNVVKVVDFGETSDGQHYMTMEYLEGVELGHVLRTDGFDHAARPLRMLAQVALALEDAHAFGVIHRDLKPDNVFLCRGEGGDDVRILDFGSVKLQVETGPKLTAFGTTLGSPYYMSPEQAKGLPDVDTRTDVFAMGAILYECLTGKIAFEAGTVAEILMKIVRVDPEPLTSVKASLPPAIDAVVLKAIAKDKNARYATPSELVDAALAAFGVSGSCAGWARRSEDELRIALDGGGAAAVPSPTVDVTIPDEAPPHMSTPAASPARSSPAASSPAASAAARAPEERPRVRMPPSDASLEVAGLASGNRVMILAGLAVAAALVLGGVAAAVAIYLG